MTQISIAQAINKDKEAIKEAAEKAGRQMSVLSDLAMVWPSDRLFKRIYYSSTRVLGDVHVTAEADTRDAALEWLNAFKLHDLILLKDSFTAIRAAAWLSEKDREHATTEITCLWPIFWKFDDYWKAQLQAYTTLNGVKVNLTVNIKNDPAFRSIERTRDTRAWDSKRIVRWTLHKAPGGESIKFSSGSPENAGNVYVWFPHESGGAAPDVAEFLRREQPIFWTGTSRF